MSITKLAIRATAAVLAVFMLFPASASAYAGILPDRQSFDESGYRTVESGETDPVDQGINLRRMLREGYRGYSVVQGGCTDGKYAYYLMASMYNHKGRILKVRMKDQKVIKRGPVVNTLHGNGMTYDSRRKRLVVVACEWRRQELTMIDAKTLKVIRQKNIKYSNYKKAKMDSLNRIHQQCGVAAIAYVAGFDCYVALEREFHNLIVIDPDTLQATGFVRTKMADKYSGTYQAMDADERYVYLLLSADQDYRRRQPHNLIVAIDWNGENLLPDNDAAEDSGNVPKTAGKVWWCNNRGNGRADAVIRINSTYEAENIYHVRDRRGRERFFLSAYCFRPTHEVVRIRRNGKTVKKTVELSNYYRGSYVYDLGII